MTVPITGHHHSPAGVEPWAPHFKLVESLFEWDVLARTAFLSIPLNLQDRSFSKLMTVQHHRPSPFPRLSRAVGSTIQSGRISILMGCASSYHLPEQAFKVSKQVIQSANGRSKSQAITIPRLSRAMSSTFQSG
ncbi:hypothetical protein [Absidia glauca]|uniref:Uncharacterized protein n=1 Tax=Absidia glauca TaxID=4829 RepID=A0A163J3R2_ABSGL|nr:hypothetical protein [Absidia glauca]